jgi:hypothetical protein
MKAPVWFLINHIDLVAGNSGYHRAMLIDQLVRHFSDWWLVGTASSPTWGDDMWDTSNAFVQEAILGGLLALIFFIAIISRAFARLGAARKAVEDDPQKQWPLWFLGSALFAHVIAYFGIVYFDHTQIAWFALLAIIAVSTSTILGEKSSAARQDDNFLTNTRLAPASPSPSQAKQDAFSYKPAEPFKHRTSFAGKLDKS